eukprot:Em0014g117a
MAEDADGDTLLHLRASGRSLTAVCTLIEEFKCDPNTKGLNGRTPLHLAAREGQIDIIRKLVRDYGCDIMAKDDDGNTPLHIAASEGSLTAVCTLIDECKCDPNTKGFNGRIPLHYAAQKGHIDIIRKFVRDYGCDVMAKDDDGDTLLHFAAFGGSLTAVCTLVDEFKCDPNTKGLNGRIPLHHAAQEGHIDIIRKFVRDYGCDVMAKDDDGDTPLHIAALEGSLTAVCTLIDEFKCDPNTKGLNGRILLHHAAQGGHIDIIRKFVRDYGCDVMAKDDDGDTLLHFAALGGSLTAVCTLVDEFKCNPNTKGLNGKTPLHCAAQKDHIDIARMFVFPFGCDVNVVDDYGKTFWHYIIKSAHVPRVSKLTAPYGRSTYSKTTNSYSNPIAGRVLVVGYPGAGKSTLVEALKSDTWLRKLVSNVPPHTAGIIPHTFEGKGYGGRVIFYDFAGDPQFNFSQAAMLEQITFTECNVVLVVVDMSKPVRMDGILYWLLLVSHATKDIRLPKVIIVGSHADLLPSLGRDPERELSQICNDVSLVLKAERPSANIDTIAHVSLDCRYTKSEYLKKLHMLLQHCLTKSDHSWRLSPEAGTLLHILNEIAKCSLACTFAEVERYVTQNRLVLQIDPLYLLCWAKELESHGCVLVLWNKTNCSDSWIITDVKQFVNTVHEQLFSEKAKQLRGISSNLGLIPASQLSVLFPHLPPSVLVSCFELLQYCFKIDDHNVLVENLINSTQVPGERTEYLFFPALLEGVRSEVKWIISGDGVCTLGWYLSCKGKCSFFPPRFVYVLLLKLAIEYSHPRDDNEGNGSTPHKGIRRRCIVWKNGIHWLMESGVEGFVEVVKESRDVVVVLRGDPEMECGRILSLVVKKISSILKEFCHALVTTEYLLDPKELQSLSSLPEVDSLQLYLMSDVKRVLSEKEGKMVISEGEKGAMKSSDIGFLRQYPLWDDTCVHRRIQAVLNNATLIKAIESLSDWSKLGTNLGIPAHVLRTIAEDHPRNARMCKVAMVETWLHTNPSATWKDVMEAVGELPDVAIAQTIRNASPDQDLEMSTLLELLYTISDWYLLGIHLRLPDTKLDEIKKDFSCSSDCLLKMLQFWLHNGNNISWSSLGKAMAKMPDVVCAQNVEWQYWSSLQ